MALLLTSENKNSKPDRFWQLLTLSPSMPDEQSNRVKLNLIDSIGQVGRRRKASIMGILETTEYMKGFED